jgi:enoyl-CoA hydratase
MFEHLAIEHEGEVAVVRIDRPPANAMDLSLLAEGHACVEELTAASPAAVVITGRPGFFSAGVDLKLAPTLDADRQRQMVEGINRLFCDWFCFPRPVVAAVNGHAIAGGLILALCADHRVGAAGTGSFGLTELKAGIGFPAVAMAVVRSELSPGVARRLVLGASLVGAEEALDLGLLDELVDGDPLPRALEVARELAALPAATYARVKEQLRGETMAMARQALADGSDPILAGWLGAEAEQGAASILGS